MSLWGMKQKRSRDLRPRALELLLHKIFVLIGNLDLRKHEVPYLPFNFQADWIFIFFTKEWVWDLCHQRVLYGRNALCFAILWKAVKIETASPSFCCSTASHINYSRYFGVFFPPTLKVLREEFYTLTSLRSCFLCQKVSDKLNISCVCSVLLLAQSWGGLMEPKGSWALLSRVMAWTIRHSGGDESLQGNLGDLSLKAGSLRGNGGNSKTVSELMTSSSQKTLRKEYDLQEFVEEVESSDLYPLGHWQDSQEAWPSWKMTNTENWVRDILEVVKDWEETNGVRELCA